MRSWCCPEKEPSSQKPLGGAVSLIPPTTWQASPAPDIKVSQAQIDPHQTRNLVCMNGQRDNFGIMLCVLLCLHPGGLSPQRPCIWLCLWKIAECWVPASAWSPASGQACVVYDPLTLQITACLRSGPASHKHEPCHVDLLFVPECAFSNRGPQARWSILEWRCALYVDILLVCWSKMDTCYCKMP